MAIGEVPEWLDLEQLEEIQLLTDVIIATQLAAVMLSSEELDAALGLRNAETSIRGEIPEEAGWVPLQAPPI